MSRINILREWLVGTRLDLAPGPTEWHGLSLIDYHPLVTARCFATTISIFLAHWAAYRLCVHTVAYKAVRSLLAAALATSYLLAVLHLHPWQPYWIRELSVMLSQLYAWKVADLALLRHGEPLPCGFWSWILFDILVLRPPALVLPGHDGTAAGRSAVPEGASAPPTATSPPARRRQSVGPEGSKYRYGANSGGGGVGRSKPGQRTAAEAMAAADLVQRQRAGQPRRLPPGTGTAAAGGAERGVTACGKPAAVSGEAVGGGHDAGARIKGTPKALPPGVRRDGGNGTGLGPESASASRLKTHMTAGSTHNRGCGGGSSVGPRSRSPSSSSTYSSSSSTSSIASTGGCGNRSKETGGGRCRGANGGEKPVRGGPSGGAARAATAAAVGGAAARVRLAAAVVWRPLLDFIWYYNACEAVNAYLMHRHTDDILAAPLIVQAWLSGCFACALYFHLQYFFHSLEMLWAVGFALAGGVRCGRWAPLFNNPESSTSPLDFWNNRWHQAFRWWWTRLVFSPVRCGLRAALDRLEPEPDIAQPTPSMSGKPAATATLAAQRLAGAVGGGGGGDRRRQAGGADRRGAPHPWALWRWLGLSERRDRTDTRPRIQRAGRNAKPRKSRKRSAGSRRTSGARTAGDAAGGGDSGGVDGGSGGCGAVGGGGAGDGGGRPAARWRPWARLRRNRRVLLLAVPTLAVFMFSALFHETLLWINFGRPTGEQTAFFLLHGCLLLAQRGVETAAPRLTARLRAAAPAPLRAGCFMGLTALSSVLFFRPWFRSGYHRELRVLVYGPTGWAVRVWVLGLPPSHARLVW